MQYDEARRIRATLRQNGFRNIQLPFQHDPSAPVGIWLGLRKNFVGCRRAAISLPMSRGYELLTLLRSGAIDGLSIGYRTVRDRIDPKTWVRARYQANLWEISIVTFPLLAGARIEAVKAADAPRVSR